MFLIPACMCLCIPTKSLSRLALEEVSKLVVQKKLAMDEQNAEVMFEIEATIIMNLCECVCVSASSG